MKNDEKRSHRLNQLGKIWLKSKGNYDLIYSHAKKMGVCNAVAKDYCETVKRRYPL